MTPRGRAVLVLGLVMVTAAIVSATVTVRAGRHDCGTAVSAHTPPGRFAQPGSRSEAEDACDRKITARRELAGVVGIVGLLVAMVGAYDHERRAPHGPNGSAQPL